MSKFLRYVRNNGSMRQKILQMRIRFLILICRIFLRNSAHPHCLQLVSENVGGKKNFFKQADLIHMFPRFY